MMLLGVTGIVAYHYFFFLSLRFTDVANTAIINALSPVVTAIAAAIFIGRMVEPKKLPGDGGLFPRGVGFALRGRPPEIVCLGSQSW